MAARLGMAEADEADLGTMVMLDQGVKFLNKIVGF